MIPPLLQSRIQEILKEDYTSVMTAFASERKGSFRINTIKAEISEVYKELRDKGISVELFEEIPLVHTFSREHEYALK
jgi:16S rRNA C967 or C1407 C5-methylase (RsmB/RsmF family)